MQNGSSSDTAGLSCKQIIDDGFSTGNGIYWIDPDGEVGVAPFQVYCDMTTEGGGWTLLLKAPGNYDQVFDYNATYWTTDALYRDTDLDADWEGAKYRSFNNLPVSELLLKSQNGYYTRLSLPSRNALLAFYQTGSAYPLEYISGADEPGKLVNNYDHNYCGTHKWRLNSVGGSQNRIRLGGWPTFYWDCSYGNDSIGENTSAELIGFGLRRDSWAPHVYDYRSFGTNQAHDRNDLPGGGQVSIGGHIYGR